MSTTQDALSPSGVAPSHRGRWIIGALVAVLIIFIIWHILAQKKPARAAPPQVVKVAKAVLGDMPETLSELGTVAPVATVTVLPQLSGYLTEVGYKEGQDVKKGQFLAQIDPRQYEIDLQQAQAALLKDQASLDQARSDLARYHELQRAEGDRRADGDRSGIYREAGRGSGRIRPGEHRPVQARPHLLPHHRAGRRPGGLAPDRSGQLRHGLELARHRGHHHHEADDRGVHRRPERSRQSDRARQFRRAAAGHRLYERQQPGDRDRHSLRAQQSDGDQHRHGHPAREIRQRRRGALPERIRQHQDPGGHLDAGGARSDAGGAERRARRLRLSGERR